MVLSIIDISTREFLESVACDNTGETPVILGGYQPQDGSELAEVAPPDTNAMLKPILTDNGEWVEGATPEELEESRPTPPPEKITETERLDALEQAVMALIMEG